MHFIPGLRLRVSEETEMRGIDESEMGELAYDYAGFSPIPAVAYRSESTSSNLRDSGGEFNNKIERPGTGSHTIPE